MKVYNHPVYMMDHHHNVVSNNTVGAPNVLRNEVEKITRRTGHQIKINWDAFVATILLSPFIDEFMLATSGAMIFVASMAWREFLQNMLDAALSIFRIESKLLTTLLNAIIFTCLAAFVVVTIRPKPQKKKEKEVSGVGQ